MLGPIFVLKLKMQPDTFSRPLVAEMWIYPDGGRIVESGTHDELLKQNAAYAALWKLQTGETV